MTENTCTRILPKILLNRQIIIIAPTSRDAPNAHATLMVGMTHEMSELCTSELLGDGCVNGEYVVDGELVVDGDLVVDGELG
jgi:hypothetical protein